MATDEWLTVIQVAKTLKLNPETVRRWLRVKRLRGVLISDSAGWRVRASVLDRYLAALEGDGEGPDAQS